MSGTKEDKGKPRRARRIRSGTQRWERILALSAIATIIGAWWIGRLQAGAKSAPYYGQALPGAAQFEQLNSDMAAGWSGAPHASELVGYVATGEATGYAGPVNVAVGVDLQGNIAGVAIVEQRETPSFLRRVMLAKFPTELVGKSFSDAFELGNDVDAVTGATYTSRALADAVRRASRQAAAGPLRLQVPPEPVKSIQFGIPELILVALYAVGFVGHQPAFKYKKIVRWGSMIAGLVVLGFIYNAPLALANINSLLIGFWPEWQTHIYWYLLVGGIVFVFTVDGKNPYCEWFCPFGAAQECLGLVGGAKSRTPQRFRKPLAWLQRGLAWLAIVLALSFRNPGLTSYEIFGTLFDLTGSGIQFALLGIVLVASMFIRRPWCTYLCPIRPVADLIRLVRGWVLEEWPLKLRARQA